MAYDLVANSPSSPGGAGHFYTPDVAFIEFDPPVRSVEFYYSRLAMDGAVWGGQGVFADSMLVRAMSRTPGTFSYRTYDSEVLYSNVDSTLPPWDTWDYVKLEASGDSIQWLWFDGDLVIDDLTITRVEVPDTSFWVEAACSPSPVTRADTVTCQATWNPSTIPASEINFQWEFESDSIRIFPDPTAEGFASPQPIDSSGMGMEHWAGPAGLGGTVTLTGTWQGDSDTASTQFVVDPRTGPEWGDLPTNLDTVPFIPIPTDSTVPLEQQPSPFPGDTVLGYVGLNLDSIERFNGMDQMIRYDDPPGIALVASGPNRGLAYISDPGDMRATRTVALRTWLTGREEPKFQYDCADTLLTNRGLLQAMRGNKSCAGNYRHRQDSTASLNGVVAHETYGSGGGRGHQGQIELAAASLPTCGRVPTIIERVVAEGTVVTGERAVDVIWEGRFSLWAAAEHYFVYGNYSDAPTYQVVDSVTVVDHNYAHGTVDDTSQGAQPDPANQPDPRYKCGRNY